MVDKLEGATILEGLTPEESEVILQRCGLTTVKRGDEVFRAGAPARSLLLVRSGRIELRFKAVFHNATVEIPLDTVAPGEVCGWSALVPPHRYTLSAYATEDSELLRIEQQDLRECCEANVRLGYIVMRNVARIIGERYELARQMLIGEIQSGLRQKDPLA